MTVNGWVKSIRRQKKVTFIAVNDGSTLEGLQAVFLHPTGDGVDALATISTGTSIRIAGELIKSRGRGQEKELQAREIELLGLCDPLVRLRFNSFLCFGLTMYLEIPDSEKGTFSGIFQGAYAFTTPNFKYCCNVTR